MSVRLREYEILYFTSIMLSAEDLAKIKKEVTDIIANNYGTIIKEGEIGKKKLSYAIKRNRHGYFVYAIFKAPADNLSEIKNKIQLLPDILRFSLVTAQKPDPVPAVSENYHPVVAKAPAEEIPAEVIPKKTEKVDLKELDLKIDELLSTDKI